MRTTRSLWGRPSIRVLAAAMTVSVLACSVEARAATEYSVDVNATTSDPTGNPAQSDSVVGSLTTDGVIGPLGPSDILNWNLQLVDNLNSANDYDLTPSDSTLVEDTGSALSATATGLSFDYSGSGEFLIQANDPGPYSGSHYFCFSTGGACLAGETISPGFIYADGAVLTGESAPVGTQPIGVAGGVPETPTWAMMILGFAGLGSILRLQRRRERFAVA